MQPTPNLAKSGTNARDKNSHLGLRKIEGELAYNELASLFIGKNYYSRGVSGKLPPACNTGVTPVQENEELDGAMYLLEPHNHSKRSIHVELWVCASERVFAVIDCFQPKAKLPYHRALLRLGGFTPLGVCTPHTIQATLLAHYSWRQIHFPGLGPALTQYNVVSDVSNVIQLDIAVETGQLWSNDLASTVIQSGVKNATI